MAQIFNQMFSSFIEGTNEAIDDLNKIGKTIITLPFMIKEKYFDKEVVVEEPPIITETSFEECPICLGTDNKDLISLPCLHLLHIECYKNLVKHNSLKCPTCRMEFSQDEVINKRNECKYCNKQMNKNKVDYIYNKECGCSFHIGCYQDKVKSFPKSKELFSNTCLFCNKVSSNNWFNYIEPAQLKYQEEAFISWVSPFQPCSYNFEGGQCLNYGNPSRKGNFCGDHWHMAKEPKSENPEDWHKVEDVMIYILRKWSHLDSDSLFRKFHSVFFD